MYVCELLIDNSHYMNYYTNRFYKLTLHIIIVGIRADTGWHYPVIRLSGRG